METVRSILDAADDSNLLDDADIALNEVVEAIRQFGGKGEITLKIKIADHKGKDAVAITTELTAKRPVPDRMSRPYFISPDGGLSRRNGVQPDIPGTVAKAGSSSGLSDDETVDEDGVVTRFRKTSTPN